MNPMRWQHLMTAFETRLPRRAALALLTSWGLAAAPAAPAAKRRRCRPACGECATCEKGACEKKDGKKRCKKSRCQPRANGTACSGGRCQGGRCVPAGVTSPPPGPPPPGCGAGGPCRVFVTSSVHTGNLGGLSGADAICQGAATRAGLPGTHLAWLADATTAPATRFVHSSGPYVRVDGVTVAANWADLTDGVLAAPIAITESGGAVGVPFVAWTSVQSDGTRVSAIDGHCLNWSTAATEFGRAGSATSTDSNWTLALGAGCSATYHLYCVQQS